MPGVPGTLAGKRPRMFDDLRVDHPLPDAEFAPGHYFQTKSIEPTVHALYVLTEDGRLLRYDKRPGPDPPVGFVVGPRWREEGWTAIAFAGDLVFHDQLEDGRPGHAGDGWVQYRARFVDGRVLWIQPDDSGLRG
jgi:hypothetical protein